MVNISEKNEEAEKAEAYVKKFLYMLENMKDASFSNFPPENLVWVYNIAKQYNLTDLLAQLVKLQKVIAEKIEKEEEEYKKNLLVSSIDYLQQIKEFEENLAKDPLTTAKKYYSSNEMSQSLQIIKDIDDQKNISNDKLANLAGIIENPTHIHHRAAISEAIGVNKEELELLLTSASTSKERRLIEENIKETQDLLSKTASLEIAHQVIDKHREIHKKENNLSEVSNSDLMNHKGNIIQEEIREIKQSISRGIEGGLSAVGTVAGAGEQVIRDFISNNNLKKLQESINLKQRENQVKAAEKLNEVAKMAENFVTQEVKSEEKLSKAELEVKKETVKQELRDVLSAQNIKAKPDEKAFEAENLDEIKNKAEKERKIAMVKEAMLKQNLIKDGAGERFPPEITSNKRSKGIEM